MHAFVYGLRLITKLGGTTNLIIQNHMKHTTLTLAVIGLFAAIESSALTIQDVAGVYIGKRVETYPMFTARFEQIDIIQADGHWDTYLYADEFPSPVHFSGTLAFNADGTFTIGDDGTGRVSLHGRHLSILIHYIDFGVYPEITIEIKSHRTDKIPDLPTS